MRDYRLIIPVVSILLLVGCKGTQTTTTSSDIYTEDLSYLRPDLSIKESDETIDSVQVLSSTESFTRSIKTELDTVNQMIIRRNQEGYYIDGYTIQLYTGNDRSKADETKALAQQIDENLIPVISYYQPTYKVRVGQYTNRLEAHMVYENLKEYFPRALLIPERIKIKYE